MVKISTKENIDKCLQYVDEENKPRFLQLMENMEVTRTYYAYGSLGWWKKNRPDSHIYRFSFKRNGRTSSVLFADNHDVPQLHNVLRLIGNELSTYINCGSFEDFCDETNYDPEDKHSRRIYNKFVQQSVSLLRIFSEDEIFCLPN